MTPSPMASYGLIWPHMASNGLLWPHMVSHAIITVHRHIDVTESITKFSRIAVYEKSWPSSTGSVVAREVESESQCPPPASSQPAAAAGRGGPQPT